MTELQHLFDAPESLALYRVKRERDELRAARESALNALSYATCPWYLGTGICGRGCDSEPACQTCEPTGGWVAHAFDLLAPDEDESAAA